LVHLGGCDGFLAKPNHLGLDRVRLGCGRRVPTGQVKAQGVQLVNERSLTGFQPRCSSGSVLPGFQACSDGGGLGLVDLGGRVVWRPLGTAFGFGQLFLEVCSRSRIAGLCEAL
jgi:hypothetical protein